MRVGEALALRWNDILSDRIIIDERLYNKDLDDPKTLHGNREVPFDSQGSFKGFERGCGKRRSSGNLRTSSLPPGTEHRRSGGTSCGI